MGKTVVSPLLIYVFVHPPFIFCLLFGKDLRSLTPLKHI